MSGKRREKPQDFHKELSRMQPVLWKDSANERKAWWKAAGFSQGAVPNVSYPVKKKLWRRLRECPGRPALRPS